MATKIKIKLRDFPVKLDDHLKSKNKDSVRSYKNNLKRISRGLYNDTRFDLDVMLSSHNKIFNLFEKTKSRYNILQSLLIAYTALDVPKELYLDVIKKHNEWKVIRKQVTQSELDNYLTHGEICEYRDKWRDLHILNPKSNEILLYYVVLAWYTYMPPMRQSDIYDSKFVDWSEIKTESEYYKHWKSEGFINCIDLTNKKINIYKQKSPSEYLKYRMLDIPDALAELLKEYRSTGAQWGLSLPSKLSSKHSSSGITHVFNRIFDCKISNDQLRAMYISEFAPFMTDDERNKLAFYMGHGSMTQELIYNRYTKEDIIDDKK